MKKFLSLLLILVLGLSCFVGCASREEDGFEETADPTKTALNVYCTSGGVGDVWLKNMEKSFEAKYATTSFESGKIGVDVVVRSGKDTMINNIKQQTHNIIFTEAASPFVLASSGDVLPITDIVTGSLSDITGGKEDVSIESKLSDSYKSSLKTINNEYYVLPHFETYSGVMYNVNVFKTKGLYIKATGGYTKIDAEKTVGPDGIKNTYDDGLPSSVEEFLNLMEYMASNNVIPFIMTSSYFNYITRLLVGMDASISGYDQYMLNYNYGKDGVVSTGCADIITGFNGETPIIENKPITPATGYLMKQRASSYYALKICEKMFSNTKYYASQKMDDTLSHLVAQGAYIQSSYNTNEKPIAMLIEGSYWYNEAKEYIDEAREYNVEEDKLQFSIMPLPVQYTGSVSEGQGRKQTLVSANNSYAFINGNIKNNEDMVRLAKLFLQYCYTNESLVDFFTTTGLFKGVATDLTGVDLTTLDYYKQSVAKIKANSNVACTISDNEMTVRGFAQAFDDWASTVENHNYPLPYDCFRAKTVSAKDYFLGMKVDEQTWLNKYSSILNK